VKRLARQHGGLTHQTVVSQGGLYGVQFHADSAELDLSVRPSLAREVPVARTHQVPGPVEPSGRRSGIEQIAVEGGPGVAACPDVPKANAHTPHEQLAALVRFGRQPPAGESSVSAYNRTPATGVPSGRRSRPRPS
jgi:hypothetical protein